MNTSPDRWEHGSEFHWLSWPLAEHNPAPWHNEARNYGSGRDALRALLRFGKQQGWQRLWMPTYLCQEVVFAAQHEIEVVPYVDSPLHTLYLDTIKATAKDAVFVVNYFGLRTRPKTPDRPYVLIEDHTHDPWSLWAHQSEADYAVASLRKCLPVPDGGILWSPKNRPLPTNIEMTAAHQAIVLDKLSGMLMKHSYLCGQSISKESYRALFVRGEENIALGEISRASDLSITLTHIAPMAVWRVQRRNNLALAHRELLPSPGLQLLGSPSSTDTLPFSLLLVLDSPQRCAQLRQHLIKSRVYPAVLWTLEQPRLKVDAEAVDLSQRLLSIHADMRYGADDMLKVTALIQEGLRA